MSGTTAEEPSHYFDWTGDEPFTDDPRYAGRLRFGFHNRVTCDGAVVMNAIRFQTGRDGWVEFYLTNEEGRPLSEVVDLWDGGRVIREGAPDFPRCQVWRVGADGEPEHRYEERAAREVLRGRVVFTDDGADSYSVIQR